MSDEAVVKSVGRVLAVLELFEVARAPLNATQIERRLDYPQSSTLALLKSLVRLGYLSFDPVDRSYYPTIRVASLGEWLRESIYGHPALPALIRDIGARTGETVSLSCQNDLQMQFIESRRSDRPLTVNVKVGDFAPLFGSIIGLTALSAGPDEIVAKLISRINRRPDLTTEKIAAPEVMAKIHRIRVDGFGVAYGAYVDGVAAVAWPLPTRDSVRPLVLSVAGPSESIRAELDDIVRHVRSAMKDHLS